MDTRFTLIFLMLLILFSTSSSQVDKQQINERFKAMSERWEKEGLAEPYQGITTNGKITPGLFHIRSTGVSTEAVQKAAKDFLSSLSKEQKSRTIFELDDPEWRKWMNQHFYIRQGVGFNEMDENQRSTAFDLLRSSLSAKGLKLTRDIMRLNHTLGELKDNNFVEYGEWLYWITVMGTPSPNEPWGWQLDGHHVIINYFVLGDQVVMTPYFIGSEPVIAESGKYNGLSILQDEQDKGLEMLLALSPDQQKKAIIEVSKNGNNNLGEAFKDNFDLDFTGVPVSDFSDAQKKQLVELIDLYISNMDEGHARIRMDEIKAKLNETYFAWIGGTDNKSVYYYRIHSPIVLIEFDHQRPAGLGHIYPRNLPTRQHIHAVVRTPNGNDYGKDLLRQHYKMKPHK